MKFSPLTMRLLKSFASINPGIVVSPGDGLRTMSTRKTIVAEAVTDQSFDAEFAISDLSRFLSMLTLFKDSTPEVTFGEKSVKLQWDGGYRSDYVYAQAANIVKPPPSIKFPDSLVKATVPEKTLAGILAGQSVLRLPELELRGDPATGVELRATSSKNPTSDDFVVKLEGEADRKFSAIFDVANILVLPGTYQVEVTASGITRWSADKLTYYIALEKNSKVD